MILTHLESALIDNIAGIFLLSLFLGTLSTEFSLTSELLYSMLGFFIFVLLCFVLELYLLPKLFKELKRIESTYKVGITIALAFFFSITAKMMGVHEGVGAFIFGVLLRRALSDVEIEILTNWSFSFFIPPHIGLMGFEVNFSYISSYFIAIILLAAFLGKMVSCTIVSFLSGFTRKKSLLIGIGLNGRGAIELIFAHTAPMLGIIGFKLYSTLVIVGFITTLLSSFSLKKILR